MPRNRRPGPDLLRYSAQVPSMFAVTPPTLPESSFYDLSYGYPKAYGPVTHTPLDMKAMKLVIENMLLKMDALSFAADRALYTAALPLATEASRKYDAARKIRRTKTWSKDESNVYRYLMGFKGEKYFAQNQDRLANYLQAVTYMPMTQLTFHLAVEVRNGWQKAREKMGPYYNGILAS
eukprot:GHVU01140069.1.p3 GENE.GHVU01140069.1~~GHVU01140069.1.p3  ORF type:complete len:179 (+),score=18.01 GHVU01140069.1:1453-1989(+)